VSIVAAILFLDLSRTKLMDDFCDYLDVPRLRYSNLELLDDDPTVGEKAVAFVAQRFERGLRETLA
jgi:hypothetical protein